MNSDKSFKNIMIIDGAVNCAYDIFRIEPAYFKVIFPKEGQDIQFIEDLKYSGELMAILNRLWKNPVHKKEVDGIDGTLYFGMENKKQFFPNKMDSDLDFKGRAFSVAEILKIRR